MAKHMEVLCVKAICLQVIRSGWPDERHRDRDVALARAVANKVALRAARRAMSLGWTFSW